MTVQSLIEALVKIIILDLVLSGDNAIVIGMAVRSLPPHDRRRAILFGGAGALVLRMIFTAIVTLVVRVEPPFLLLVGGVVLVWITYRLLTPEDDEAAAKIKAGKGFWAAMQTIIIADVTMSLDNVLAVGVAADGDVPLVLVGLVLSMAIIVAGGALVSTILNKLPWLNYVGGLILMLLSGEMIANDPVVKPLLGGWHEQAQWVISGVLIGLVSGLLWWNHHRPTRPAPDLLPAADAEPSAPK